MGNRIQKVCTASQGMIHRPSPEERDSRPNKPLLRFGPLSATSMQVVSVVLRVRFETRTRTPSEAECLEDRDPRSLNSTDRKEFIRMSRIHLPINRVLDEVSKIRRLPLGSRRIHY